MKAFSWLLRREIWEHRAFWIVPLVVSGVLLIFTLFSAEFAMSTGDSLATLRKQPDSGALNSDANAVLTMMHVWALFMPYAIAFFVTAIFYCMDALYADRRDRSSLFWKSLPVSDTATVLSKVVTAVFVAPLIVLAIVIIMHLLALVLMSITIMFSGTFPGWYLLWHPGHLLIAWASVANSLFIGSVLLLPIYGWFFLASAWARKGVFLWAVAPPLLVLWIEWAMFDVHYLGNWIVARFSAFFHYSFNKTGTVEVHNIEDLGRLQEVVDVQWFWTVFSAPQFWSGFLIAAVFISVAIWLRRWREEG